MIDLKQGDCLELMKSIPDESVDMILCDLPYGTTKCKWDKVIDFDKLWKQYNRVSKPNTAIVLFGRQPFTSKLVDSNINKFKYELIWEKDKGTDFGNANRKPLNAHEDILIFYDKQPNYHKQLSIGKPYVKKQPVSSNEKNDLNYTSDNSGIWINKGFRTPKSVIKISRDNITKGKSFHPTQKPVKLLEYLIKTYTKENDIVLDNCMGSGSTGVACVNTKRDFIGMELDEEYFRIAEKRIQEAQSEIRLDM